VELVGDGLGERGVGALPLVGDTDQRGDGAARLEAHRGSLLPRDRRAAHAVELRAWTGELDEAGKADAEIAALRARRRLLASQAVVRRGLQQPRQRRLIAAAVVDVPRRRGVRELLGTHEIAAAHLDGVELEVARDQVDHALRHRGGDRVADRAVLRGDDLVLRDHLEGRVAVPQTVGPGQETEHLATFHDARARIGEYGPTAAVIDARIVVRTPSRSAATSTRIVCSRAWMSDRNDSLRAATNLTGRPSTSAIAHAAMSSW